MNMVKHIAHYLEMVICLIGHLTKNMMDIANTRAEEFMKDVAQYIPANVSFAIKDHKTNFMVELGKQLKENYDSALGELEHILNVDLGKFRTKERVEPLKLKKK